MEIENIKNSNINIFQKYYLPLEKEIKQSNNDFLDYSSFLSNSTNNKPKEEINISKSIKFKKIFYNSIIPYLSLKDLISFKLCSKITNSFISKKSIDICVLSNSVKKFNSSKQRTIIWNHYLNIDIYKKKLFEEDKFKFKCSTFNNINEDKDILYYNISIELIRSIKNKNNEEKDNKYNNNYKIDIKKLFDEDKIKKIKASIEYIRRDVDRTYYNDYFIKGEGKNELTRVLESMCTVKGSVGYCQGMNFIVGAMIYLLKSEINGFYMFNCLLNSYELSALFEYNTPDYNTRVFQLNYYVKKYLPQVFHHFKNNNLSFDLIYSGWFLTLFSNYYDIEQLDFPWTCFIIDKWKGIIKVCLIIMNELKNELIKCDLESLTSLIKENNYKINNFNNSINLYKNKFKVTNKQLRQLKNEYYADLVKKKLEETNTEIDKWEEDQREPLSQYLKEKKKIENNVIKDIETYKLLNEESNKKYLFALKKYDQLMNNVNLIKKRLNNLASIKYNYEELFDYYKDAINQIDKNKYNNQEQKNNLRNILENEKNKILEKYLQIKDEFIVKNELLYKQCDIIDKIRNEIKNLEKEKNKRRQQMQDFLFLYEKKQDQLIKNLSDKLKLSSIFKKTNKF